MSLKENPSKIGARWRAHPSSQSHASHKPQPSSGHFKKECRAHGGDAHKCHQDCNKQVGGHKAGFGKGDSKDGRKRDKGGGGGGGHSSNCAAFFLRAGACDKGHPSAEGCAKKVAAAQICDGNNCHGGGCVVAALSRSRTRTHTCAHRTLAQQLASAPPAPLTHPPPPTHTHTRPTFCSLMHDVARVWQSPLMLHSPATALAPGAAFAAAGSMFYGEGERLMLCRGVGGGAPLHVGSAEHALRLTALATLGGWVAAGYSAYEEPAWGVPVGRLALWAATPAGDGLAPQPLDPAAVHGDEVLALGLAVKGAECAVFSGARDGSIRRSLAGGASLEFPREFRAGAHTRAVTALDVAFGELPGGAYAVRVLTGSKDRTVRMWKGESGELTTVFARGAEACAALPPPAWDDGPFLSAAQKRVVEGSARAPPPGAPIGEGCGWGAALVPQEVVAACRFVYKAHNYATIAYADGTLRTFHGHDEHQQCLAPPVDRDCFPEASMVGAMRYDGDAPVRLTAFAVLTLGEKPVAWGEGFPPPHFLLGFSDGSVEVKCVGALDSNQVRLTPAETACDGLGGGGLWGGAGGAGGGGGGGRRTPHRVTALCSLSPGGMERDPFPSNHHRYCVYIGAGFTNEEGHGWFSVFKFFPYANVGDA